VANVGVVGAHVYNIHLTYDSLMWAIIDYS
jgi:hypothetical protein